jgi:branched-chain amino acid transport system permease protein
MTTPLLRRLLRLNAVLVAVTVLVLALVPAVVGPALVGVIAAANCYVVFAASWDILSGYTGQVSFGHAAFIGAGGFTVGLLSKYHEGIPAELQLLAAMGVAALLGVAIGVPCLRLRGPYLALATLSAASALFQLSFIYKKQTGGEEGIAGIPRLRDADLLGPLGKTLAKVFTFGAYGDESRLGQIAYVNYYVTLVVMLVVVGGLLKLGNGRRGLVLRSIQQDESAAEAAGVPVVRYKLGAFVLSGALAGLGGGLLVQTRGSAGIDLLLVSLSLLVIITAALGGVGSILGPAIGAYLVILLQNYYLDKIGFFEEHAELKPGLFALVLIVVLIVQPRGLVPPVLARLARRTREDAT